MGGTYNFTIKAIDADGMGGAQSYSLFVSAGPTAATISIGGRVLTDGGSGLSNATVTLTGADGAALTARTSSFGFYRFENVSAGQTAIVRVVSKRFAFEPQIVNVVEDIEDLNFVGNER